MAVIVYRGVKYEEALQVIARQSYEQQERRTFLQGIRAKAVFGQGVYLVSNPQVAAEYAYCHAEAGWDKGAILRQTLDTQEMMFLTSAYGENELRQEALLWEYTDSELLRIHSIMTSHEWQAWTGERIRAYLQDRDYHGIVYPLSEELTYYVSYQPEMQIADISLYGYFEQKESEKDSENIQI
ncbi:hypothetical protein [Brevibacillus migulae]|uniref:hypothetical protein n=1 Tax=Brevibacillus migulae TaxID=1644114 RepID=UPI00106EADAE|nr:hypothetical protein [Brevibacillus migulae]